VRLEWSPEELLASWTLVDGDWKLVASKTKTVPRQPKKTAAAKP
jgi:hypothetical protein